LLEKFAHLKIAPHPPFEIGLAKSHGALLIAQAGNKQKKFPSLLLIRPVFETFFGVHRLGLIDVIFNKSIIAKLPIPFFK
jgi:hypothetical protein